MIELAFVNQQRGGDAPYRLPFRQKASTALRLGVRLARDLARQRLGSPGVWLD
jgi:hypothetical protein